MPNNTASMVLALSFWLHCWQSPQTGLAVLNGLSYKTIITFINIFLKYTMLIKKQIRNDESAADPTHK